jgi:hypothetical protein
MEAPNAGFDDAEGRSEHLMANAQGEVDCFVGVGVALASDDRNHWPQIFPKIVLPFSARKPTLPLGKMAYNLTARASGKSAMRPKNRVWGFSGNGRDWPLDNRRQRPEPHRKSRPTATIFTPGIPQWPSRDPIEESGGVNLFGFLGNSPLSDTDVSGLISAATQAMLDFACKAKANTDKTRNEWCFGVCRKCNKETGEVLAVEVRWKRGIGGGCMGVRQKDCTDGYDLFIVAHTHPGGDPSKSPEDDGGIQEGVFNVIVTGATQSMGEDVIRIVEFNKSNIHKSTFYNCKKKQFLPK